MKNYSKMEGVLDCPHPCSERLELNFSHVEMGLLTQQVVVAPITFGPPQAEGTGESVVFHAQVTWILRLLLFSVSPTSIIGRFLIPLTLLSLFLLSFRLLGGLWVCRLHTVYIRRLGRGSSQTSGLAGHFLLYRQLLQLF
jgi:hypothetical protein